MLPARRPLAGCQPKLAKQRANVYWALAACFTYVIRLSSQNQSFIREALGEPHFADKEAQNKLSCIREREAKRALA